LIATKLRAGIVATSSLSIACIAAISSLSLSLLVVDDVHVVALKRLRRQGCFQVPLFSPFASIYADLFFLIVKPWSLFF
jgi:hypothetical protein